MSHFTVLVIGQNPEQQLAPFQENNMGDCPIEYMEFEDFTEKLQDDYAKEDEETKNEYPTIDSYATEYQGYRKDQEKGVYGRWHNPNSKWDWYELGGRWTGFFKLKLGIAEAVVGNPGIFTEPAKDGYADSVTKGEIDFEYMRNEAANKASQTYDLAVKIFDGFPINDSWDTVRSRHTDAVDKAREEYWSQPRCVAWQKYQRDNIRTSPFGFDSSPDDFIISKDQYLQNARDAAATTFAIIKDGHWYERGAMGWWGMIADEKDRKEWNKQVAALIDSISDETILSVYDCHI